MASYTLGTGDYTVVLAIGGTHISLTRGGTSLLEFPADACQLGVVACGLAREPRHRCSGASHALGGTRITGWFWEPAIGGRLWLKIAGDEEPILVQ